MPWPGYTFGLLNPVEGPHHLGGSVRGEYDQYETTAFNLMVQSGQSLLKTDHFKHLGNERKAIILKEAESILDSVSGKTQRVYRVRVPEEDAAIPFDGTKDFDKNPSDGKVTNDQRFVDLHKLAKNTTGVQYKPKDIVKVRKLHDGNTYSYEIIRPSSPGDSISTRPAGSAAFSKAKTTGVLANFPNPTTISGYKRGKPFPIKVVTVAGKQLEVNAAKALTQMIAAAKKDDINLNIVSGFRSMKDAKDLRKCYLQGERFVKQGLPRSKACNDGNLAGTPGWSSHQQGGAVDISGTGCKYLLPVADCHRKSKIFRWLKKNAKKYNFYKSVRGEAWHWQYSPTPIREKYWP